MTDVVVMRGIGNTCIECTSQILSIVCNNGLTLEVIFHILADDHLKYDIMIGREILNQGFDKNVTQNSLTICKTKVISICNKAAENEVDINEVDTEVLDNDENRLISILEKFKGV
jgi:hypothetical protein